VRVPLVFLKFVDMFFLLSKILDFAVNPFYWVLICFAIGLIFLKKGKKSSRKWLITSFLLLVIFTNPLIISITMNSWQVPAYPASSITTPFDYGILMGGSMRHYDEEIERPVYSMSVDRLLQTIALYKEGKIKKILLSGGSGHVFLQNQKESFFIAKVLLQAGVPEDDILVEDLSRNTYENAIFTRDLVKAKNLNGSFLLITSAFHMRRSVACFKKAGLTVFPYPVDGKLQNFTLSVDSFLPEPFYFTLWDQLIHEWVGMIAYKFSGYI
jgi:uncharacterized SAM-binding protein YcdF (DUF218 family)